MKKMLILVGILALTLSLIACGNDVNQVETNVESQAVAEESNDSVEESNSTNNETDEAIENSTNEEEELAVGKRVPDYELTTLEGDTVSLHDYDGKIILLNFWATWWPYCNQEMPDLVNINQEEDVVVLAVNVREDLKTITDYMDENKYDFQVIVDEDGDFASKFYVASFPTSFFIDEEGILLGRVPGMVTAEMLDEIMLKIRNDE